MLKFTYNDKGQIIGKYQDNIEVPEPFLLVTEEKSNEISQDSENVYFVENGKLVAKPKIIVKQEAYWTKNFFNTSLGWIRREPTLANGTKDNFLNNNLPLFAFALFTGQAAVLPISYQMPDFTKEFTEKYLKELQIKNQPITDKFINDCMLVKISDFVG